MDFNYTVLMTDYAWPSVDPERKVLSEIGAELIVAETGAEDELVSLAPQADGILTCWEQTTTAVVRAAERCQVIGRCGIGLDNIDVKTATELGIVVTNVPAYCIDEVSDHTMALLLACARKISLFDREVKSGNWVRDVGPPVYRIRGKTLGIVGFGKIGRALVPKARAFGLDVVVYSPSLSPDIAKSCGVEKAELSELLARSDFITIHAPLNANTEKLFGKEQFRQMKETAYIINTSRGGIIDTSALYGAVKEGWIAGAGLDVLAEEPPAPDEPLVELDNIVITPHAAFASEESTYDLEVSAARAVADVLIGKMPESVVNQEVLESPLLRAKTLGNQANG
ncbi:MAG: C-terminal binding protein [Candidatus Poribacteria bacterium]|nr:C-terminal binding protein [Candidatus Poribacteria bacterium]MDE0504951.1 C-terminal binding protein [Candidatus Poribacteria bacterium]